MVMRSLEQRAQDLHGPGRRPLILPDDLLPGLCDSPGIGRIGQALSHGRQQVGGVLHFDGPLPLQQDLDRLAEVECVRAEERAFAERRCFHHVRAAHGDERAAHKNDLGQRVEFPQVAHSVAEDDGVAVSAARVVVPLSRL